MTRDKTADTLAEDVLECPQSAVVQQNKVKSAWLHEVKHLDDDHSDGFLGMRVFADRQKCIQREMDAYAIEIELARNDRSRGYCKKTGGVTI